MEENIFDWLYENREAVLSTYAETGGSPKQVWDKFPELESLTKFNSFKTYLKPVVEMLNRVEPGTGEGFNTVKQSLDETTLERDLLKSELSESFEQFHKIKGDRDFLRAENERLQSELNKVKQEAANMEKENERLNKMVEQNLERETERLNSTVKQTSTDVPANVEGWTVAFTGGYYKLFKKVGGKVKGIHLGKVFDRTKALEKIAAKETELGIR